MRFPGPLIEGRFRERLNRFAALVDLGGASVQAHVPNSGRMRELLVPGHRAWLVARPNPRRRTRFDLALVEYRGRLVGIDSRLPSFLLSEAILAGGAPPFVGYTVAKREAVYEESRLDLLLTGQGPSCFVETKSVNLVEEGLALFPDAPTERGARHLRTLAVARGAGHRAAVAFVVQRDDAQRLAPYDAADAEFGRQLRLAVAAGVEAYAFVCRVTLQEITVVNQIPVVL